MNVVVDSAFILHTIAWRETSLIVEAVTRSHGRLGLIAKGARRPRSALRGLLQPFQPLELRWTGKGELRTLVAAEWVGGMALLDGSAIMPGFYLNELLVRLLPREDAHPALFEDYRQTLCWLSDKSSAEPALRRFEARLLREMGYAPDFDRETRDGNTGVMPEARYVVEPQTGIRKAGPSDDSQETFHGATLIALARASDSADEAFNELKEPIIAAQSKRILRLLLGHQLGEDGLASREVMRELARI